MPQPEPLARRIEQYDQDVDILRRYWHLPCSEPDRAAQRAFFESQAAELAGLAADDLDVAGRIDAVLLRNQIAYELDRLELEAAREAEVADLLPFAEPIVDLARRRRAVERIDPAATADTVHSLAATIKARREALQAAVEAGDSPPLVMVQRAADLTERLRGILSELHGFRAEYDPVHGWWLAGPQAKADAALEAYWKYLREELLGIKPDDDDNDPPLVGQPVGPARLAAELQRAMIPYTAEELIAIGRREYDWCQARLREAAAELGLGDDTRAAIELAKRDHVPPGEQPYLIDELAREAIAYVEEHDLLTLPPLCRDLWRMEMMTPERQKITPFFTGGEVISVSFPTSGMRHLDKQMSLRGNNRHFCRATVHHELIPGHHLQLFAMTRRRPYRQVFRTAFFIEGWTLHWEMLLWDRDFAADALNRVGMLFWRMHRCARVVFSLRYHLGEMTAEECVDYLVEAVAHEPANARAEVRRAVGPWYEPLYQCAYLIGGLQVRALYGELIAAGWTPKQVHDALLGEGPIPVELVRAALRGDELPLDHAASWRFDAGG